MIVDVGAGSEPDPRADVGLDLHADADLRADLTDEWPLSSNACTGLIASHVVEHLPEPGHFFDEAGRVLERSGWLEVTVPVGADARADPDHEHVWTWRTPAVFCREHSAEFGRAWDPDPPFVLADRDLSAWLYGGRLKALNPLVDWLADIWPAELAERATSGELTARYRRVDHAG